MYQSISRITGIGVGNSSAVPQEAQLREACQKFEAFFWMELLKSASRSINSGDQSSQGRFCTELFDQQYALMLAKQDTAGLGKMLYERFCSNK